MAETKEKGGEKDNIRKFLKFNSRIQFRRMRAAILKLSQVNSPLQATITTFRNQ